MSGSGKIYELTIYENRVMMALSDFIALAGELQFYGVDVDLDQQSEPGRIVFKLKEASREQ
jgi:hypothetical protein